MLLAQDEETAAYLKDTEFTEALPRDKSHYIAVAYLNLYEEAYFYFNSKVLGIFSMLPDTLWQSIQRSMKNQLKENKYLRTMWESRKSSYSSDFVTHVTTQMFIESKKENLPKRIK